MGKYIKVFDEHSQYETFRDGEDYLIPNVSYCILEDEVHYNYVEDPFNNYEYVDLGLPSGTLWAKMNVGANSPTDYGLYFAWGETQGYADASIKAFTWSDYKWTEDEGSTFTKYNATDGLIHLELADDAAHVNMGGNWHMPTKEQCNELLNPEYVTNEWVENYNGSGINGHLFISVSNGNTMFIPAAGYYGGGEVVDIDINGIIWASTPNSQDVRYAWDVYFDGGGANVYNSGLRCCGQSVRGVVGEASELKSHTWYEDHLEIVLSKPATNVTLIYLQIQGHDPAPEEITLTSSDGITWTTLELAGDKHCASITVVADGITVGGWSEHSGCKT